MSSSKPPHPVLLKHPSWSPDIHRDLEWQRLKTKQRFRYYSSCEGKGKQLRRSQSVVDAADSGAAVTDDDIRELKACFELGFGFDPSNGLDPKLARTFPALELFAAVNRRFLSRSSSMCSETSCCSSPSGSSSNRSSIVDPSDEPEKVKMRLKQWAQVVACSVRESSPKPLAG